MTRAQAIAYLEGFSLPERLLVAALVTLGPEWDWRDGGTVVDVAYFVLYMADGVDAVRQHQPRVNARGGGA